MFLLFLGTNLIDMFSSFFLFFSFFLVGLSVACSVWLDKDADLLEWKPHNKSRTMKNGNMTIKRFSKLEMKLSKLEPKISKLEMLLKGSMTKVTAHFGRTRIHLWRLPRLAL